MIAYHARQLKNEAEGKARFVAHHDLLTPSEAVQALNKAKELILEDGECTIVFYGKFYDNMLAYGDICDSILRMPNLEKSFVKLMVPTGSSFGELLKIANDIYASPVWSSNPVEGMKKLYTDWSRYHIGAANIFQKLGLSEKMHVRHSSLEDIRKSFFIARGVTYMEFNLIPLAKSPDHPHEKNGPYSISARPDGAYGRSFWIDVVLGEAPHMI